MDTNLLITLLSVLLIAIGIVGKILVRQYKQNYDEKEPFENDNQ